MNLKTVISCSQNLILRNHSFIESEKSFLDNRIGVNSLKFLKVKGTFPYQRGRLWEEMGFCGRYELFEVNHTRDKVIIKREGNLNKRCGGFFILGVLL